MTANDRLEKFINENPDHPKVKSLLRLMNKPLSINSAYGTRLGEVSRLADEAYT